MNFCTKYISSFLDLIIYFCLNVFFSVFFFKQKTAYEMRISDWSSDVCSSDLLAHPLLRRTPDIRAVEDFMALGYVPDDACIVAGVKKLGAGHCLLVERGKPVPKPVQYWDLDFSNRARGSASALEEELVQRMRAAVRSRSVADVPLGRSEEHPTELQSIM